MGQHEEAKPTIKIDNGSVVSFSATGSSSWSLLLHDLVLIGEYTDGSGPSVDDYFLVFMDRSGEWNLHTFYGEGRDTLFEALSGHLGSKLVLGLCHSAECTSRVVWPNALVGAELFDFVPVAPRSFWGRIRNVFMPGYTLNLRPAILQYLESCKPKV